MSHLKSYNCFALTMFANIFRIYFQAVIGSYDSGQQIYYKQDFSLKNQLPDIISYNIMFLQCCDDN